MPTPPIPTHWSPLVAIRAMARVRTSGSISRSCLGIASVAETAQEGWEPRDSQKTDTWFWKGSFWGVCGMKVDSPMIGFSRCYFVYRSVRLITSALNYTLQSEESFLPDCPSSPNSLSRSLSMCLFNLLGKIRNPRKGDEYLARNLVRRNEKGGNSSENDLAWVDQNGREFLSAK